MHWFGLRELCSELVARRSVFTRLCTLQQTADAQGVPAIRLARVLAKLSQVEMVGIFEADHESLVYLTHKAGAVLGLKLTSGDSPRWIDKDEVEPRPFEAREDGQVSQDASDVVLEQATARQSADADDHERAETIVYGLRTQWPIAGMDTVEVTTGPIPLQCPGCGNRRLHAGECCVICVERSNPPLPEKPGRRRYLPGRLRGGVGA